MSNNIKKVNYKSTIPFIFFFILLLASLSVIYLFTTDFGNIDLQHVIIPNDSKPISGLLYIPKAASQNNPLPCVILAHGISNAKETMSDLAVELSRNNVISLAIDDVGHGDSGGVLHLDDISSLGVSASIDYVKTLPFVDTSKIGLIGHSLGAGAVVSALKTHQDINSVILIGGGIGPLTSSENSAVLNATYPKNLLIIIGSEDVLFSQEEIKGRILPPIFNSSSSIITGQLYGSFDSNTARKLITPKIVHIFEPIDPETIITSIDWIQSSLKPNLPLINKDPVINYSTRDLFNIISFILIVITIIYYCNTIYEFIYQKKDKLRQFEYQEFIPLSRIGILSFIALGVFLPVVPLGFVLPFPPAIFGSSIAWWVLGVGVVTLLIIKYGYSKSKGIRINLWSEIKALFNLTDVIIGIIVVVSVYIFIFVIEIFSTVNIRLMIPIFNVITLVNRLLDLLFYIPFFLIYFIAESILFAHITNRGIKEKDIREFTKFSFWATILTVISFIVLLIAYILPMFLFNLRIIPGMIGFFIEFLFLIFPLLLTQQIISYTLYYKQKKFTTGIVINTLLISWICASLFPLTMLLI
ncbi:MAG: alpha/beta hydrolase [Candidatus Thorarchaeota archaeon]